MFRGLGLGVLGFRVQGLYRDNGKENGNYCLGFRVQGFRVLGFKVSGFPSV